MSSISKLGAALTECGLHAQVLRTALDGLTALRPFTAEAVRTMAPQVRQQLDQVAYRFMKLQDTLGERVLPGLLDLVEEPLPPSATFQQKLNRLERLGALESVESWRLLRETRNQIAHEYPDAPAIQAAVIEHLLDGGRALLGIWDRAARFYQAQPGDQV